MLSKLRAWLKQRQKRKFYELAKAQLERLHDAQAPAGVIEAKRATMLRAKKAAGLCALLAIGPQTGCAHEATVIVLETAAIATGEALAHCEGAVSVEAGDTSEQAQAARLDCLHIPDFDAAQDAVEVLADEMAAARLWVKTGRTY